MLSTDRQTDKQTNATKNITAFAKEVITHLSQVTFSALTRHIKSSFKNVCKKAHFCGQTIYELDSKKKEKKERKERTTMYSTCQDL